MLKIQQWNAHKHVRKEVTTILNTEERMTLSYVYFIVPL